MLALIDINTAKLYAFFSMNRGLHVLMCTVQYHFLGHFSVEFKKFAAHHHDH